MPQTPRRRSQTYRLLITVSALVTLIGAVSAPRAQALGTARFNVAPAVNGQVTAESRPTLIYQLAPGLSQQDAVVITNTTSGPLSFNIYPVDAITTVDGSYALLSRQAPRRDVGAWVALSQTNVTVNPGQALTVPFTISIPLRASVGAHNGGIAVEEATPHSQQQTDSGGTVNIVSRVGIRIYETVPGDLQNQLQVAKMSRSLAANGHDSFTITLRNDGNANLSPVGKLMIRNVLGHMVESLPLNTVGTIAPGRSVNYQLTSAYVRGLPQRYSAQLAINYAGDKKLIDTAHYAVYSWLYVLFIIAGLAVLVCPAIPKMRTKNSR